MITDKRQQMYQERLEEYNKHRDAHLGSTVRTPDTDESFAVYEWFHRLMTECGLIGVEYIQEAYHSESQYLSGFSDYQEVLGDVTRYANELDIWAGFAHIYHNGCGGHTALSTSDDPEPPDPDRYGNMRVGYECGKCFEAFTAVFPPNSTNLLLPEGFEDKRRR